MRKAHPLIERRRELPAILDTNLLLLLWCAAFDPDLVSKFKRLNSFRGEDVVLLRESLRFFPILRTTPHVLAEVSNLTKPLARRSEADWSDFLVRQIETIPEEWVPAKNAIKESAFALGLTDAALCLLAKTHVIFTIDFPLSNFLETQKLNVINFNHLRGL